MPYELKQEMLDELIGLALKSDEIQTACQGTNLTDDFLRLELRKRLEKVRNAATQEMAAWEQKQTEYRQANDHYENSMPQEGAIVERLRMPGGIALMVLVLGPIVLLIISYFKGFKTIFGGLISWPWNLGLIVPVAVAVVSFTLIHFSSKAHARRMKEYDEEAKGRFRLPALMDEVEKLEKKIRDALLEKGIKTELRSIINSELQPSYSTTLSVTTAPGLAEVFDPAYEISTGARQKVLELLENMPGGSIGIAGPRGAGKSTLIWSLCRGAVTKLKDRPLYALMTSAPVKYDARDFILHLFSSLCYKVLGINPGDPNDPTRRGPSESIAALGFPQKLLSRRLVPYLLVAGYALIALGGTLTWLMIEPEEKDSSASGTTSATIAPVSSASTNKVGSPNGSATLKTPEKKSESAFSGLRRFLKAADLKPGIFIWLGFGSLALASVVMLYKRQPRYRDFKWRGRLNEPHLLDVKREAEERLGPAITEHAIQSLRDLRFQQSFSSGWGGSLSLPVGLKGSLEGAVSLAEQQRSLPEIVEAYRRFVGMLASKHIVLIGIDELDKLESDEAAQQFLNEIKSIFGLDNCYYLLSVSENAISSFERRGLPIRDAFDSAFDTIVHVDYLDLRNAKQLLRRRVIGMEVPFICLCYALSGGLARDLIRACRELLELARAEKSNPDLRNLCTKLIMADVRSKIRALTVSVMRVVVEPDTSNFLACLHRIEAAAATPTDSAAPFLQCFAQIPSPKFEREIAPNTAPETVARRHQTHELTLEMHTYFYFAATLLEFFSAALTEEILQKAEATGAIDALARARQSFAVNPYVALSLLDDFRRVIGMTVR